MVRRAEPKCAPRVVASSQSGCGRTIGMWRRDGIGAPVAVRVVSGAPQMRRELPAGCIRYYYMALVFSDTKPRRVKSSRQTKHHRPPYTVTMPKAFSNIRSAAIDGRLHNPVYVKSQLKKLHDVLSDNASEIQRAIARDTGHRAAEIKVECWLAMRCVADAHAAIDTEKALSEEYAVARGEDAPGARAPAGIVVVEPGAHTFFYSIVSALVPAMEAGNCVVVQVSVFCHQSISSNR